MPKPEDFGITDDDWTYSESSSSSKAKIKAYKEAVEAWKHAASSVRNSS